MFAKHFVEIVLQHRQHLHRIVQLLLGVVLRGKETASLINNHMHTYLDDFNVDMHQKGAKFKILAIFILETNTSKSFANAHQAIGSLSHQTAIVERVAVVHDKAKKCQLRIEHGENKLFARPRWTQPIFI